MRGAITTYLPPTNPTPLNAYQGLYEQQIGYSATNSPASVFTCNNNEAGCYRGFEFLGNNAGTLVNSRISGTNINGIVLAKYLGMDGIIGQQGSPTGNSHGNYFNTAPGATTFKQPGGFQSFTINSNGGLSPFYYSTAAAGEVAAPNPNGFTGSGWPIVVSGAAPFTGRIDCSIVPTGNYGNSAYRLVKLMISVDFYLNAGGMRNAPYQQYLGQAFMYATLRQNDTMMADDADVQAFMATNATTAIGMEYTVDSLLVSLNDSNVIANGNQQALLQTAIMANSMIPPDNIFAQLQQKVNAMYLQKMVAPVVIDSTADIAPNGYTNDEQTSLKSIAVMCTTDGGPAVFMARSLVHSWDPTIVFVDDSACTGYSEDYNGDNATTFLPYFRSVKKEGLWKL